MAKITRPVKLLGNTTYVAEVAAAVDHKDVIRSSEVDADFKTIYDEFNGKIIDENIADGAEIDYDKLNLTGQITNSDIAPTATIDRGKLQPVPIAFGFGIPGLTIGPTPTSVVGLSSMDFTGGIVILVASLGLSYRCDFIGLSGTGSSAFTVNIDWTWYRDDPVQNTRTNVATIRQAIYHRPLGPDQVDAVSFALTGPPMSDSPLAATYQYGLQVSSTGAPPASALSLINSPPIIPADPGNSKAGIAFAIAIR